MFRKDWDWVNAKLTENAFPFPFLFGTIFLPLLAAELSDFKRQHEALQHLKFQFDFLAISFLVPMLLEKEWEESVVLFVLIVINDGS